tara:strand:+ start:23 stop:253 length:231 start_codon:yes stop_codon:yes gene_type:complete
VQLRAYTRHEELLGRRRLTPEKLCTGKVLRKKLTEQKAMKNWAKRRLIAPSIDKQTPSHPAINGIHILENIQSLID